MIAPAVQAVWLSGGSVTMLHQPTPRTDLALWSEDTVAVLGMIGANLVLLGSPNPLSWMATRPRCSRGAADVRKQAARLWHPRLRMSW